MPVICPTVTAETPPHYHEQIERIAKFAQRIHIDLMDGQFTPNKSPDADEVWWPVGIQADIHLMFKSPLEAVKILARHTPNLIIVHAEAEGDFNEVVKHCRGQGIKIGVALLAKTDPDKILPALSHIDHVMIYSGNLGYQGGSRADLGLLDKVRIIKSHKPSIEIGWDGGVNDQNVAELINGGVDVLNAGGYIQKAEDPARAYHSLQRIADETGTT